MSRVFPVLFLLLAGTSRAQVIGDGNLTVAVNRNGVLVDVPPQGIHTFDGPRVDLMPGLAEWFGVSFDTPTGHVVAVGRGLLPDWAGRPPVERIAFVATRSTAVATTRAGDLEIRTEFSFDPIGGFLLVGVTLTNTGTHTLTNVVYTREWLQASGAGWSFPTDMGGLPPSPDDICRRAHMTDDIAPGASRGWNGSFEGSGQMTLTTTTVPLALWTDATFPAGLDFGNTNGISFGDYDADGWIDVFALQSGNLWKNDGGTTWHLAANLTSLLGYAQYRYGSSFGDYDRDGLPDIVTEPREAGGDQCAHLLHNIGGGPHFRDVSENPSVIGTQPCAADAETACWGDVDGDGHLDFFLPAYPPWAGGPGNFFHYNRGPVLPGGAFAFFEQSAQAGLDNPFGSARPEGAQFYDVDGDGDIDLYSNGTIYRNESVPGTAHFVPLTASASGISLQSVLEEGAAFLDYDLDGDQDLAIVYSSSPGTVLWENRGDGTFFRAENGIIDSPLVGLDLGLSVADWDNDGDIDFTTRQVFRQNLLVETGMRHFVVESHPTIPAGHITSATPAWGDWDKDGDLDCALGNWLSTGHFYENVLYDASTPDWQRRAVRVRPVRDETDLAGGTDTEYGATVELRIVGRASDRRRKGFTSSSAGYLNQNDYAVSLALPPHPDPAHPDEDLEFDVVVDFPGPPAGGVLRIDRHVNPHLAAIPLAHLADREIRVFRSGKVVVDGGAHDPLPDAAKKLLTAAGGLELPGASTPLSPPGAAPAADWFVGLALTTNGAGDPQRIEEVVLDGQLAEAVHAEGGAFNIALWDVTDPQGPFLPAGARIAARTSSRNHRTSFPCDWELAPHRLYRVVARVSMLRASGILDPDLHEDLRVLGGLSFADPSPLSGAAVAGAVVDPTSLYLTVRFR